MNWAKFLVYVKCDDTYAWEALVSKVQERMKIFRCDQLLVVLVNTAHSLSSEAGKLFDYVSAHFAFKLDRSYRPEVDDTLLNEDDLVKILTIFIEYNKLTAALADSAIEYIKTNIIFMKFETLADLSLIFTIKCPVEYRKQFFEVANSRILNNISFTDDELFYKFLYAYVQGGVADTTTLDMFATTFVQNHVQFKNKLFLKSVLLLTHGDAGPFRSQIYSKIESDMTHRFNKMHISDLVDMLWWLLQQEHKNDIVFNRIQDEIKLRMNNMKDQELLLFLRCFTENSSEFSSKLIGSITDVISKKITKYETKTLVGIVWSFSRLNLQADEKIVPIFMDIKNQLISRVPELAEKSLAMMLWSYSREESPDQKWIETLITSIKLKTKPKFDNFDLLLIVQACKIFEGSYLKEDNEFASKSITMLEELETQISREINNMNIHEFMTISSFYILKNIESKALLTIFKNKVVKHMEEFSDVQLSLLICAFSSNTLDDHSYIIETLKANLEKMKTDKETVEIDQEKLRQLIRQKLIEMKEKQEKMAKMGFTKDEKVDSYNKQGMEIGQNIATEIPPVEKKKETGITCLRAII